MATGSEWCCALVFHFDLGECCQLCGKKIPL